MDANKNSASNMTDDYKWFYSAERRAILDTVVFHCIALVNIEILILHFPCNKSPFNGAMK